MGAQGLWGERGGRGGAGEGVEDWAVKAHPAEQQLQRPPAGVFLQLQRRELAPAAKKLPA